MIRNSATRDSRKEFEQEEEFSVASGVAFLAALNAKYSTSVMPEDIRDYMSNTTSIAQTTGAHGSLGLQHTVSKLQLFAVQVPFGSTGLRGGVDYTWMRSIQPSTGLGCHQGSPWVTSTFNEVLQKLVAPLDTTSGNFGSLVTNPAYSDFGSLAYLTDVLAKSTGSWLDESPLIRCLLLADTALSIRTIRCDAMYGQISLDGHITNSERVPPTTTRPAGAMNPERVEAVAVAVDSWVALRTGQANVPDWGVHDWSYKVAIVPLETSMMESNAVWIYTACFLTSHVWNNRHVWKVTMEPKTDMSSAPAGKEYDFYVRPRASGVEVDGPGRVMFVITNITSRVNMRNVRIGDLTVPLWNPTAGARPGSVDIMPQLLEWLDLAADTNHVTQNWLQAWKWLSEKVSSGNALNHALFLTAEASRVQHIAPAAHPTVVSEMPFYSIKLRKNPPGVMSSVWAMRNWADVLEAEDKEKQRLKEWVEGACSSWLSPLCIHSNMYGRFDTSASPDWSHLDWLLEKDGYDQSMTCHEATPDMRIARFVGLIAVPTPMLYVDPAAVQETVSAIASFQVAGMAWMQMTVGIPWLRWSLYTAAQSDVLRMTVQDRMMNEATSHHVCCTRPNRWWINVLPELLGLDKVSGMTTMIRLLPSVLPAWWQVKYVVQKMNYLIPGELERRQRPVNDPDSTNIMLRVGFYSNDSKQWQAVARYTSMLGIRTANDVPMYAVNSEIISQLTRCALQLNLIRVFTMCGESMYASKGYYDNPTTIVDTACALTPLANSMLMSVPAELLILHTKAGAGTGVGDHTVLGEWPDPWWDWLLAGVRAAVPFLGSSIPTAALVGAASGLHAFLAEKLNPAKAKEEQLRARAQAMSALDTSAEAITGLMQAGREAKAKVSQAMNDFISDQQQE